MMTRGTLCDPLVFASLMMGVLVQGPGWVGKVVTDWVPSKLESPQTDTPFKASRDLVGDGNLL